MTTRELPRTLGLRDLVLAHVLIIVGLNSLGTAAKLGSFHWLYWILGIALFHLPLAAVVIHLSRRMPIEGGLYQWVKAAFGPRAGFLVAWNFWMFVILFVSQIGMILTAAIGYALGWSEAAMNDPLLQIVATALAIALLTGLAIAGFATAKWVHNVATGMLLTAAALVIVLPVISPAPHPAQPPVAFSFLQLVIVTRVIVYALAGFECMSVVAGECRDARRTIARSIAMAVPIIAAVYILGTNSLLAYLPLDRIDLVNPVAQVFAVALRPYGRIALGAGSVAILLLIGRDFAQTSQVFAAATRMPLVAGWDHFLPEWVTRLHPRTKTPVLSIAFAGAVTFVFALGAILAAGRQEAFQILLGIGGVLFAVTYLAMFAIPLLRPAPVWLRAAAACGWLFTAAFLALSFVPIVEVQSATRYAAILAIAVVAINAAGAMLMPRRIHDPGVRRRGRWWSGATALVGPRGSRERTRAAAPHRPPASPPHSWN